MKNNSIKFNQVINKLEIAKSIEDVVYLWNKVATNKYQYSLSELWKIIDLSKQKALIVKGKDIDKGKFYNALDRMKSKQDATL